MSWLLDDLKVVFLASPVALGQRFSRRAGFGKREVKEVASVPRRQPQDVFSGASAAFEGRKAFIACCSTQTVMFQTAYSCSVDVWTKLIYKNNNMM